MKERFSKKEDCPQDEKEYMGNSDPKEHIKDCTIDWESWGLPKDLWVHAFIHILTTIP